LCHKEKVDHQLSTAIKYHIQAWIEQLDSPYFHSNNKHLSQALDDQTKIGWNNFMRGFISSSFQKLINHQRQLQHFNHYEEFKWTSKLIRLLWHHEMDHWRARNASTHGITTEEKYQKARELLLKDAQELYSLRTQLSQFDQHRLFRKWYAIPKLKNRQLDIWLRTTQRTVHYLLDTTKKADDDPCNSTAS
jgi:hypothetical protein